MSGPLRLYGTLGSGSAACEAALALSGLDHELIDLAKWDKDGPAPKVLTAINPLGQVPVLALPDGSVMTESAAILIHVADLAPASGLAPLPGAPLRPLFLRWMLYLAAQSYPTVLRVYYPERFTDDPSGAAAVNSAAIRRSALEWSIFAEALGDGPFILGDKMCAVDLYAAMFAGWDVDIDALFAAHPNLKTLCAGVAAHPVAGKVWQRHGF